MAFLTTFLHFSLNITQKWRKIKLFHVLNIFLKKEHNKIYVKYTIMGFLGGDEPTMKYSVKNYSYNKVTYTAKKPK